MSGDAIEEVDAEGRRIVDDTFLILLNAHHEPVPFVLPAHRKGVRWETVVDTATADPRGGQPGQRGGESYELAGRSLALLRLARGRMPRRQRAEATEPPTA
jgi:glycogen operon protein